MEISNFSLSRISRTSFIPFLHSTCSLSKKLFLPWPERWNFHFQLKSGLQLVLVILFFWRGTGLSPSSVVFSKNISASKKKGIRFLSPLLTNSRLIQGSGTKMVQFPGLFLSEEKIPVSWEETLFHKEKDFSDKYLSSRVFLGFHLIFSMDTEGLEPPTCELEVRCSTNWAIYPTNNIFFYEWWDLNPHPQMKSRS